MMNVQGGKLYNINMVTKSTKLHFLCTNLVYTLAS